MKAIVRPSLAQRWGEQADAAHQAGRLPEALTLYRRLLKTKPPAPLANAALYRIAVICWQIREHNEAQRILTQLVAKDPSFLPAQHLLGVVHETRGEYLQAIAAYEKCLLLDAKVGDVWEGLGKCLLALGDPAVALQCFEKAIALAPPMSEAVVERRYNMSFPLLSLGRWKEGWEAYEARFDSPVFMGTYILRHHEPVWDGAPLAGRRLLVHAEQGFGDSLMMARYLPLIDGDVHIEVQRPLLRLFQESFPTRTVTAQGDSYPPCDLQLAMMSLPHRFGMTAENVPTAPWLRRPWSWRGPDLPAGEGLRVGFVWAGSADHRNDRRRSIGLDHWKPLWSVPGVTWYSLQVDQEPVGLACHNLKPLIRDFADTAALIAQLDLVICCDTSVAHLAGGLGVPTWILLPSIPDYRWCISGTETVWYPSARLVRQPAEGDWTSVFVEVKQALEALVALKAA